MIKKREESRKVEKDEEKEEEGMIVRNLGRYRKVCVKVKMV